MDPQLIFKRKRGAQPGNTNALKHGYYAAKLLPADRGDLENHLFSGVSEEAEILRVFIRRVVELSACTANMPLDEAVHLLRILALSVTSLSHVLRTDQILFHNEVTRHDLARRRRVAIRLALSDAADDAKLAAELADRLPPGQTGPLPVLPDPDESGLELLNTIENPTFAEAAVQLTQYMAALDARYPWLAVDDEED